MERSKNIQHHALASILFLLGVGASHADQQDLFFDNQIIPIVLSASKLPQPQTEAPASITVIDRALIDASGATQIAELFRLVPGMQVGNSRGNFPVVAYQGLTSEFPQGVQVIIDGSSVYSPIFGGVIWSALPIAIEDIERIEIVRGPNNASFGANSFQGVINITTLHASQALGLTTSFRINNNQSERAFFRFADSHNNDQLNYRVSVVSEKSEGYKNLADDFSKNILSSRVDLRLNTRNTLQFNFSALDSKRQTRNPLKANVAIDPKRDRNESTQFAQLVWEHQTHDSQQFRTQLSFQHFDGKDKYTVIPNNSLDLTSEATTWNLDVEHILSLNSSQRLVWGLGAIHESVYAPFRVNSNSTKTNTRLRLFGNLESKLTDRLFLNAGGLIEHDQLSGVNTSPRVTLNYLTSPNHSYRLTATTAFRAPVITEENREINLLGTIIQQSAGNLKPETITSVELGYHGIYFNNAFNTDLKLFKSSYKQLIDNNLANTPAILDNEQSAKTYGAELEINYRPNRKNIFHAGYAYSTVNHASDDRLEKSIPKHNLNFLFSHQYDNGWHNGIEYYYMSKMQYLGGQNDAQSPFQRLDLSIGKKFKVTNNQTIDITLDAQLSLNKNVDMHEQATADNLIYLEVEYRAD